MPRRVPVVNAQLRTLEARKYQEAQPNQPIRIDHNSHISHVQREADDRLRLEFAYTTAYGPLGLVKVEGTLWYQGADAGDAVAQWEKTRNLPVEVAQQVHGAIMAACVPQAVGLAKDLRLPPPIPLPQVRFQKPGEATVSTVPSDAPEIG